MSRVVVLTRVRLFERGATQQHDEQAPADMAALLAERGLVVTDEDRARARRRLAEARQRRTCTDAGAPGRSALPCIRAG